MYTCHGHMYVTSIHVRQDMCDMFYMCFHMRKLSRKYLPIVDKRCTLDRLGRSNRARPVQYWFFIGPKILPIAFPPTVGNNWKFYAMRRNLEHTQSRIPPFSRQRGEFLQAKWKNRQDGPGKSHKIQTYFLLRKHVWLDIMHLIPIGR